MTVLEVITAAKDIALAGAAIATAIAAWRGLGKWSAEIKGKAAFDVARGLAKATYKLRDEVRICCTRIVWGYEYPKNYVENLKGSEYNKQEAKAYAYLFENRFRPVIGALREYESQVLEAEALWGSAIWGKTDALRMLVRRFNVAHKSYVGNLRSGNEDFKSDPKYEKETKAMIFSSQNDAENELNNSLDNAMKSIQSELLPHLSRDSVPR